MSQQLEQKENTLHLGKSSLTKQNHQFWVLQISGWIGYCIIVFFAIIRPQFTNSDFSLERQLINLAIEAATGFVLSYLQWLFIRRIVVLKIRKVLLLSFISAALLGLLYNIIKLSTYKVIVYQQHWDQAWNTLEFGGWLLFSLTTMFVWTSIFFIMLYNAKLQKEHEMLLRAQTLAKESQLQMLRYQLNPHFMFNTMNAISTLILKKENIKANEMLEKLCEFFRYTLQEKTYRESTFAEEIDFLNLYVSIERVRFGERLGFKLDVCDSILRAKIPSLFLQPLIENAIKFAIEPSKDNGLIEVSAKRLDKSLQIIVKDSGVNGQAFRPAGFGIGISNTKARLDTLFNGDFDVDITQCHPAGCAVTILIPYQEVH